MIGRSDRGGADVQDAGLFARGGQELAERAVIRAGIHRDDIGEGADARDRQEAGGLVSSLLLAFEDLVRPVLDAFESTDAMEYFWFEFGWDVRLDDVVAAEVQQAFPLAADRQRLEEAADTVRQAIDGGTTPGPEQVAELAGVVGDLLSNLTSFAPSALSSLPPPLSDGATWEDVAEQLLDQLLERYLRIHQPVVLGLLVAGGCVRYERQTPTGALRLPYTRVALDWGQLGALLDHPAAALAETYRWNDPAAPFEHEQLLVNLGGLLHLLGLSTSRVMPPVQPEHGLDPTVLSEVRRDADGLRVTLARGVRVGRHADYEIGADLLPAAPADAGDSADPTGLVLRPRLNGSLSDAIAIGSSITLTATVAAGVGDVLALAFYPGDAHLVGGDVALGAAIEIAGSRPDPWYPVGSPQTARVEVRNPRLQTSLAGAVDDPELRVTLDTAPGTASPGEAAGGVRIVVPMADADSFAKDATGRDEVSVDLTPVIVWSSKSGLTFNGALKLEFEVPLSVTLGPITVTAVTVALGSAPKITSTAGIALTVGARVRGALGPITFVLDQVGFVCTITPYSRADVQALPAGAAKPALGSVDVGLQFAPPNGVGISVSAGGVVSGGGFLKHTGDEYAGAFDLSICGYAVKAYGLIQTTLPAGQPGYSFVAVLSVEFVPEIDLPFDFTLKGVGGLVGVNRTISIDAVEGALWAHHLDGLLFPADPVAAAPQLISALGSYFPPAKGRYVFGPLAKLGWAADIVTGEAALLLELPEPLKLLLIGDVQVGVPSDSPQLVLHISFDGGVDVGKQLAFFDATLHDSRLESYPISGDLAFRYSWGDQGVFALALGGFNPQFQPPAGFPTLKRLAISISSSVARIEAQSYLALTSNTLQFGARVELTAGTGTFNVHGWLGFDALCERNPLAFEFDLTAGVDLRAGTDVLASVHLDGKLSGPTPWHIAGKASLSLLFFDVTVHFDKSWGSSAAALPAGDLLPTLTAALADRSAWSGALPPGVRGAITPVGSPPDAGDAVLLDPAGTLRISQRVVPLDQPITRFAGTPLGQTTTLSVGSVTAFGNATTPSGTTSEEFAPAQFLDLTDAEKLSLPSFSSFDAGVELAGDAVDLGNSARTRAVITPITYITTTLDSRPTPPKRMYLPTVTAVLALNERADGSAPGLGGYGPARGTPPRVTLAPDAWTIASTTDLTVRSDIPTDGSKLHAYLALKQHLAANPGDAGALQVVLTGETA